MKKIYLLEQHVNGGYDTFDSMIVIAEDIKEAILLSYKEASMLISKESLEYNGTKSYSPLQYLDEPFGKYVAVEITSYGTWALEKDITIQELGYADLEIKESYVVCSSFNAG